ncbi:MAG TPA: hypothetical protein IGR64_09600 [Leptolyngbyaceae cyanobacterium M65_K2018_010]|nr:hypothetical protein [Leptolyngbyaceae cyanobacterium M65_K2018_010]
MIFRSRSNSSHRRFLTQHQDFGPRPLLHVLAQGQSPADFQDPIEHSFKEPDVIISRAELDLRRAVQSLMILTGLAVNSLEVVTALELPGSTAALFWAIRLLLDDSLPAEISQSHQIRKRDHDSRLLYQALARVDLDEWYATVVDKASITALPVGLQFLPGHPLVQRYYRQHPLPAKQQVYLPVATYFATLFRERKQELVQLLTSLGATRLEIRDLRDEDAAPEVFIYPGEPWTPGLRPDLAHYIWLPYEPTWQRVLADRSAGAITTASLELTVDINGMIALQLAALKNLLAQLDSVEWVDNDRIDRDYLKPHRLTVTFAS